MARVPRKMKIQKGNVIYENSFDRTQYTIRELTRAAQMDTARLMRREMLKKAKKQPGMRRSKRPSAAFQYWVRRRELDLIIGSKHDTWYGADQELGTSKQPKRGIIKGVVMNNINNIRKIQGQYLSAVEDENKALGLIRPDDDGTDDTGDVS